MPHQSDFLPIPSTSQMLLAFSATAPQFEQKYARVSFGTVTCFFQSFLYSLFFGIGSITFFSYPFHSIEEVLNMRLPRFHNYMFFELLILNHTIHKKIHLPHSFRDILPGIISFSNYIEYFLIWYESIRSNIYTSLLRYSNLIIKSSFLTKPVFTPWNNAGC